MNRKTFYDIIRLNIFSGKLLPIQVQCMERILDRWGLKEYTDIRWLAYMLATTYHETAGTMCPIKEYGQGVGRKYGRKVKHSGVAYSTPHELYYGRGFVQLTWYENYELMGRLLGRPLLVNPDLALDAGIATEILFEGMLKGSSSIGDFTGKCLEMYFNDKVDDPIGARKIINGTDKAGLISSYHTAFLFAIKTAV